jgi:thiosulfate reductase cytochrome b subunit
MSRPHSHLPIAGLSSMPRSAPYQPSLLRLLHGVTALLFLGAAASGYWVYDQFDGRWGRIGLPMRDQIQQSSLKHLTQVQTPMWWQSLHRLTNTFILGGAILAVLSGSQMNGSWLINREFNHGLYTLHLSAWAAIGLGFILHLLMNLKIGGVPLLLSIFSIKLRPNDTPKQWPSQILKFLKRS